MDKDKKYIQSFIKDIPFDTGSQQHCDALKQQLLSSFPKYRLQTKSEIRNKGIIIMKNPVIKLAAAAIILIGLSIGLQIFDGTRLMAAEVFSQAVKAMTNLRSVHIQARMRTIPRDNFDLILLNQKFVLHDLWIEYGPNGGKWRVEKSGRVVVMDGQQTLMLIRPTNHAAKGRAGSGGFIGWLRPLLDVESVLDSEIRLAKQGKSDMVLTHETGTDGREKLVVTAKAAAQGDLTHDWLKNKCIMTSDHYRLYCFDADTKLLEAMQVYIQVDDQAEHDVLVFEITDIRYNPELDPALFTLELPKDVSWFKRPEPLEDQQYQQMGPKQMATAFFKACAAEDWDEADKFCQIAADEKFKKFLGKLEIIHIGEPFKSGLYPGWFVPYEIRLKCNNQVRKHNLAVRNDNPGKRYVVDGGL